MTEYTFSIIKPDAVARDISGLINSYLEKGGLSIAAQKMTILTKEQAEAFYAEHKSRGFFDSLISYMISGPVILQVLKGDDAVIKNRQIMGATNPSEAAKGTIRGDFAENIEANSVHGSDSIESAQREISFFFTKDEIVK